MYTAKTKFLYNLLYYWIDIDNDNDVLITDFEFLFLNFL